MINLNKTSVWQILKDNKTLYFWTLCLAAAILFNARQILAHPVYGYLTILHIDFLLFYDAAEKMFTINPYEIRTGEKWISSEVAQYLYSPLFLIIMQPFTWVSEEIAFLVWRILISVCLIRSFILALRFANVPMRGGRPYLLLIIVTALLQRPLLTTLSNIAPFLLWIAMESYILITSKRYWRAGALLALAINIKLILLPVLVYWVWRGYWRILWIVLFFSILYLILPALVFGWNGNLELLSNWYSNLATPRHFLLQESYINKTLVHLSYLTPLPVLPHFFVYGFVFFLILWTLYILGRITPSLKQTTPSLVELSYILLIIPFIYPRQHTYALVLAMPCLIWITHQVLKQPKRSIARAHACLSYLLLIPFGIPFSLVFGYQWHITYPVPGKWVPLLYYIGLLSLIPLLSYLKSRESIFRVSSEPVKRQASV